MKMSEFVSSKSLLEFIEYGEKFDDMKFKSLEEVQKAVEKLSQMLKAYGFQMVRPFSWKPTNTSWFWKLTSPIPKNEQPNEYWSEGTQSWEIQLGWVQEYKTVGQGSNRQRVPTKSSTGMFRVRHHKYRRELPNLSQTHKVVPYGPKYGLSHEFGSYTVYELGQDGKSYERISMSPSIWKAKAYIEFLEDTESDPTLMDGFRYVPYGEGGHLYDSQTGKFLTMFDHFGELLSVVEYHRKQKKGAK